MTDDAPGPSETRGVSPSSFMRKLRPEYYSDTIDRNAYTLDAPTLEYHLDSLTKRNETHDFEIFCRKLCERAISPNLRPQTGPEGGGDSKADLETFPVSDEVSALYYTANANGGRERWAFAFSAKVKWADKVRSDVRGIVETGRKYDRIICVTSQFARAKTRAELEKELTDKHGIPVTVHDRSWIVVETIEKDRKDIAFNYLGVGTENADPHRLGPTDYSRSQQLADIEKSFEDPEAFKGMERQRVTEALIAAKLSRNMERPRHETDGRFQRAIRLASADGSYRQNLEARYEYIWTGFWWFDDFKQLNDSYSEVEERALKSTHAKDLEFLANLHQLLVNSIIHRHLTREQCQLDQRTERLKTALEKIAAIRERPNNSLEAQASLQIMRMNSVVMDENREVPPDLWDGFSTLLDNAEGLGEFDAGRLVKMIKIAGSIAGDDPAYNTLVEKLAGFVSRRKSEGEGALILLDRAKQIDNNFELIRLLGKAVVALTKKEYADQLIEATQILAVAYRGAGLLWSARANWTFAAATLIIEAEEITKLPPMIIPTLKYWAWSALQLRHIPDFLNIIQLLNGCSEVLPLDDSSKELVRKDLQQLDAALGCLFLNLPDEDVCRLDTLPDILEGLRFFTSRTALLYTLGHLRHLREDGSIPREEDDEGAMELFSMLMSQPFGKQTAGPLILNEVGVFQLYAATLLGMKVEITLNPSDGPAVLAEIILGALEAFFATTIEQRIVPHTEKLSISLTLDVGATKPAFDVDVSNMTAQLVWLEGWSPVSIDKQQELGSFVFDIIAKVLGSAFVIEDPQALLDKLYSDEAVQQRVGIALSAPNSHHRIFSQSVSRLSEWAEYNPKSYPLQTPRPPLKRIEIPNLPDDDDGDDAESGVINSHRDIRVHSVIDKHLWEQAGWHATAYGMRYPFEPPWIGFTFKNAEAGRKIFERWRERFGSEDEKDEIHLGIIRKLPGHNDHDYILVIGSRISEEEARVAGQSVIVSMRSMTMFPSNETNLKSFLEAHARVGAYRLVPAVMDENNFPHLIFDLAILKRKISVRNAADVADHDIEATALHQRKLREK